MRAAGALDGEVAFLAGSISKDRLFGGGVAAIAGSPVASPEDAAALGTERGRIAYEAFVESAAKAVASLAVSAPRACEVILSGRVADVRSVRDGLAERLLPVIDAPLHVLQGFTTAVKHAAQGAALIADGLAGGSSAPIVDVLGIREAHGTVLDHLHVITPAAARARLGIG